MPRGRKYFDDDRRRFLMSQASKNEKRSKKLKLEAQMIDDRIIKARDFMDDDNFIKSNEFKKFLFKIKRNELKLQMKPGDSNEEVAGLIYKL